jgi:hypothetical protein
VTIGEICGKKVFERPNSYEYCKNIEKSVVNVLASRYSSLKKVGRSICGQGGLSFYVFANGNPFGPIGKNMTQVFLR